MTIHTFGAIDVGSYEQELKIFEVSKARGIRAVDSLVRRVDLGRPGRSGAGMCAK